MAPDKSLSLLNITEREENAGRWCEHRPWRAACDFATTAATLGRPREQTCALIRHTRGRKTCGPRHACHQGDSSSDERSSRDES